MVDGSRSLSAIAGIDDSDTNLGLLKLPESEENGYDVGIDYTENDTGNTILDNFKFMVDKGASQKQTSQEV